MTNITISKCSDEFKEIECDGHSGFDEAGRDIYCSAISILVFNLAKSIDKLTDDEILFDIDEDNAVIKIKFINKPSPSSNLLVYSFIEGLKMIKDDFQGSSYLSITYREV